MMEHLKLLALDEDDLRIVSAHMQDAVFKSGDLTYDRKAGQFILEANRFVWEKASEKAKGFERRRALLVFKRIEAVRTLGIDRKSPDSVQNLLAIEFKKRGDGPEGTILLVLAGKAAIELDVECIEVQLADTGGAWETGLKPRHPAGG
jgi:hypothetical protein